MEVGLLSVKDNETTLGDGIVGLGFVRPSPSHGFFNFIRTTVEGKFLTRSSNLLIRIIFQRFYKNNFYVLEEKILELITIL